MGPYQRQSGWWHVSILGTGKSFCNQQLTKISRPPLPYSESKTSQWYANNLEVYSATTPKASYEDEWIAEFWSDDLFGLTFAPPPRMVAIMDQVFANENLLLKKLFMLLQSWASP